MDSLQSNEYAFLSDHSYCTKNPAQWIPDNIESRPTSHSLANPIVTEMWESQLMQFTRAITNVSLSSMMLPVESEPVGCDSSVGACEEVDEDSVKNVELCEPKYAQKSSLPNNCHGDCHFQETNEGTGCFNDSEQPCRYPCMEISEAHFDIPALMHSSPKIATSFQNSLETQSMTSAPLPNISHCKSGGSPMRYSPDDIKTPQGDITPTSPHRENINISLHLADAFVSESENIVVKDVKSPVKNSSARQLSCNSDIVDVVSLSFDDCVDMRQFHATSHPVAISNSSKVPDFDNLTDVGLDGTDQSNDSPVDPSLGYIYKNTLALQNHWSMQSSDCRSEEIIEPTLPRLIDIPNARMISPRGDDAVKFVQDKGFLCQICRVCCSSIPALKRHIKSNHSLVDLSTLSAHYQEVICTSCKVDYYICLFCSRTYYSVKKIVKHFQKHQRNNCYRCELCVRKFFISGQWHMFSHKMKPVCNRCQLKHLSLTKRDKAATSSVTRRKSFTETNAESSHKLKIGRSSPTGQRSGNTTIAKISVKSEDKPRVAMRAETDAISKATDGTAISEKSLRATTHDPDLKPSSGMSTSQKDDAELPDFRPFAVDLEEINWDPIVRIEVLPDLVLHAGGAAIHWKNGELVIDVSNYRQSKAVQDTDSKELNDSRNSENEAKILSLPVPEKDEHIIHLKNGTFKCKYCHKEFMTHNKSWKHIELSHDYTVNHPNKQHVCHKCKKRFAYLLAMQRHVRRHYEPITRCEKCHKIYTNRLFKVHAC